MPVVSWNVRPTVRPRPFRVSQTGTRLYVYVGDPDTGPVQEWFGSLLTGGVIRIKSSGDPQLVPTHSFILPPWRGEGMPEVCMHPQALAHLFVSDQIPRGTTVALAGPQGSRQVPDQMSQDVSTGCAFTKQLHVRTFRLTLSTVFSVTVRAAE